MIAYVMRRLRMEYDDALALVRKYRPLVTPNEGFEKQLRLWRELEWSRYDNAEISKVKERYLVWLRERQEMSKKDEEERNKSRAQAVGKLTAFFAARRAEREKIESD